MRHVLAAAALAAVAIVPVHGSTGPIPLKCDRACLEGVIPSPLWVVSM